MVVNILLILFILLAFFYYHFLISIIAGLKKIKPINTGKILPEFISVIIPFRNESDKILENLKSIEALDYPKEKFEVIYVDDFSDDNSYELLCKNKTAENIRIISSEPNEEKKAYKKRAVFSGIKKSKGDIIVTSDADCIYNKNWLINLLTVFDDNTGFVSGPVEFNSNRSIFSELQKTEFAGLVLTGAGLIGINKPIICNGANLAYRREAFNEVNGFDDQYHLSSGEDEILMQKIHKITSWKIKFCMNKNAVVRTDPVKNLNEFFQQRKRWASKGFYYESFSVKIKLVMIFLFYLSLIAQLFMGVFVSPEFFILFSIIFLLKVSIEYFILQMGSRLLFSKDILYNFLLAEILQLPYIVISGVSGIKGNFIWKKRKVAR